MAKNLSQVNFIEKILRDKNGRLVRAKFCVYESTTGIKARLVDFTYIEERAISGKTLALSGFSETKTVSTEKVYEKAVISPYLKEILFFTGSKPRAPAF